MSNKLFILSLIFFLNFTALAAGTGRHVRHWSVKITSARLTTRQQAAPVSPPQNNQQTRPVSPPKNTQQKVKAHFAKTATLKKGTIIPGASSMPVVAVTPTATTTAAPILTAGTTTSGSQSSGGSIVNNMASTTSPTSSVVNPCQPKLRSLVGAPVPSNSTSTSLLGAPVPSLGSSIVTDDDELLPQTLSLGDSAPVDHLDLHDIGHILEYAKIATNYGVDLQKEYNPGKIDPSDEKQLAEYIEHSGIDTSDKGAVVELKHQLFIAEKQRMHLLDGGGDNASGAEAVVADIAAVGAEQVSLDLLKEIPQIATDSFNGRLDQISPLQSLGLAAGENNIDRLNSVWIRGIYGYIKQGQSSKQIGFQGPSTGATIGIDGNLTDNSIIGVGYTNMYANFKYKYGHSNKVNTTSNLFSIYGANNLNDNFLLHGLFIIGKTKVKQKIQRLVDVNKYRPTIGKFTVNTYSLESVLDYKIPMKSNQYYIIPNIGFRFDNNFGGGYSEYGAGVYNMSVSSKNYTTWTMITGIKMGILHTISDNLVVSPGVHAEIDHYIYKKIKRARTKMQWADEYNNPADSVTKNTGYNLGATLLTTYNNTKEFLFTYNLHLRGKYISNQGSFRFRLLF